MYELHTVSENEYDTPVKQCLRESASVSTTPWKINTIEMGSLLEGQSLDQ